MPTIATTDIRKIILEVLQELQPKGPLDGSLQQGTVLNEVAKRLVPYRNEELELAILTLWGDLFRTGYLAWGQNLTNPNPPFLHITDRGRRALAGLSRDPGNPAGYVAHLNSISTLNPVALSYLMEGLECFTEGLHKAAAVMIGASAESLILEVRDAVIQELTNCKQAIPRALQASKVKQVTDELDVIFRRRLSRMPYDLRTEFEAFWPVFTQQIRTTRNDAGHPVTIDPVSPDVVHASFLAFPELARTASKLLSWTTGNLT